MLRRILIIEDDLDVAAVLKFGLESGFDAIVDVSANGEEGLVRARGGDYDLILCDLMMPKVDGLEVARQLKQEEPRVAAPIIFVTGAKSAFRTRTPQQHGAIGVISKPIPAREICARIRQLLAAAGVEE